MITSFRHLRCALRWVPRFLGLFGFLVFSSCGNWRQEKTIPGNVSILPNKPKPINARFGYEDVKNKVFLKSCISCHGSDSHTPPNLTVYSEIQEAIQSIDAAVFQKQTMPKGGTLTNDQLEILKIWIEEGTPEFANPTPQQPTPPSSVEEPVLGSENKPVPPKKTATWSQIRKDVIDVSCSSCHFKGNDNGLTDQTDLKTFQGSLATSIYLIFLEKDTPMPPLPAKLDDDQKRLITEWLIDGQKVE